MQIKKSAKYFLLRNFMNFTTVILYMKYNNNFYVRVLLNKIQIIDNCRILQR